jgi:hypothetical protein
MRTEPAIWGQANMVRLRPEEDLYIIEGLPMLTHSELAKQLHGRKYPLGLRERYTAYLKTQGLVVVHPHSDDNMELEGAITDEFSCYGGDTAYVCREGVIAEVNGNCEIDDPPTTLKETLDLARRIKAAIPVTAVWGNRGEVSWRYELPIPHSTFDLMEDSRTMAKGVVFSINDLPEMGA